MVDPLSGHTAAGNILGADGLRDGDALASPTLTNILQGLRGNGIIRLQDIAYGSNADRNAVNSQPGAVERASTHTLTITGGYVILDGQLYEFAGGPGGTSTITLGTDGSGTALATTGEQSMYVVYLTGQGGQGQVHVSGGTPVKTSTGLYPSIPSQYLTNYDTSITRDNQQVVVLSTVRCGYSAAGGSHKVDILEVNDKRHFIRSNPIYMFPLSKASLVTDGTEVSQIRRNATDGVQSPADLRGLFGLEPGKLGLTSNSTTLIDVGAMWMSTSRSGSGVAATATITITDYTELSGADKVNLVATEGTNYDFVQGDQSSVNGTFEATTSNNVTATNLMNVINTSSGPSGTRFTATVAGAVVTATQAIAGVDGNTTVTLTDSGTAGMTKIDFTGGVSYGFGPGGGLDRGSNQMKDELFFAGQENSETGLVSKRLFSKGVAAPSAAISTSATYSITSYGDSVFILSPATSKTVTLKPEKSGSNYLFPEGHTIEVVNNASSGGGNIVFDPTGLNSTVAAEYRGTFIFEGSLWLRTAYETASSSAATNFLALTDVIPSSYSGQGLKGIRVRTQADGLEFFDTQAALAGIDDQTSSNDDQLTITDTAIIINEDSDNLDFRVESNANTHMLFVDGGSNKVGINQSTVDAVFQIEEVGFGYVTGSRSGAGVSAITLDLFDVTKFRACEVLVEVEGEDGSGSDINEVTKILMTHNGSGDIPISVYGQTQSDSTTTVSGTDQAIYTASVVGGQVQLQVTPAIDSIAVTAKVYWRAITI